jgi:two-component system NtrC family sensor kinase
MRGDLVAGERVLIIDDSLEIQDVLRDMVLEPNGYRVLTADNGEEGLRVAMEEQPDLIVLDERMPGINGVEVLKRLRKQEVQIPVIFTTFHGNEDLVVQIIRLGVQAYIIKPFEPQEMEQAVERVLEQARLRGERDRLTRQIKRAKERLERQVQEMRTLYSIGRSMTSLLDLNAVLTRVVEAAVFVTRSEEGLLLLIEPESRDLVLRAAKNLDEKVAHRLRVPVSDSLVGQVVHSGSPVLVSGEKSKVATGYLVNSLVYVPIRTPERGIIGVLGVTNRRSKQSFTDHEVQLLSALSDYAAVALENARLYEDAEAERLKLETVLQETGDGIVVLDQTERVLLANPPSAAALDLPPDTVGRPAEELFQHPVLQELLRSVARTRQSVRSEIAVSSGQTFHAHLSPVEGVGYVLLLQDVTHFKELDRIKSEFVSTVSHDLRTPLTTIQGYISLLDRVGPLNEQQVEFVDRIRTSVADITDLISELLDLGRIEAGYDLEMEPLQLERIISDVVDELQPLAGEKDQDLTWNGESLPSIQGNPRRLRQVIENLVGNAIKYTDPGGRIAVSTRHDDDHVVVRVSDNGIGIPLADQPYIFERFYRVESEETEDIKGTGLGLTIVKSVVEKHGGRVWVESRPGAGSTFTFVLPTMG